MCFGLYYYELPSVFCSSSGSHKHKHILFCPDSFIYLFEMNVSVGWRNADSFSSDPAPSSSSILGRSFRADSLSLSPPARVRWDVKSNVPHETDFLFPGSSGDGDNKDDDDGAFRGRTLAPTLESFIIVAHKQEGGVCFIHTEAEVSPRCSAQEPEHYKHSETTLCQGGRFQSTLTSDVL